MIDNRYAERYIVDTPESIEFGYEIAGLGPRFLAASIDAAIFALIGMLLYEGLRSILFSDPFMLISFLVQMLSMLYLVYYIAFERLWNGQTPGKRLLRIRVVEEAGRPVGFMTSVIRNLLRLIDFFPMGYCVAIISIMVDKRNRRLGDLVAGTLVVREGRRISLDDLLSQAQFSRVTTALSGASSTMLPNLETLRYQDIQLVQEFLLQRTSMPQDRRQRLAGQLAYAFFQQLGYSVPGDPEQFLVQATEQYLVKLPPPQFSAPVEPE